MDIRRERGKIALADGVMADVLRIETIFREVRNRSGGPFLFGGFSAADAMFAPVVSRFDAYDLVTASDTLSYMSALKAHPAWLKSGKLRPGPNPGSYRKTRSELEFTRIAKNLFGDWSTTFKACISAQNSRNRDTSVSAASLAGNVLPVKWST